MSENVERHYFATPERSDEDPHRERCATCGENIRDGSHIRATDTPTQQED